MKLRLGKKCTALLLSFLLLLTPVPALAQPLTDKEKADIAGQILSDIMANLLEHYVGDDISAEQLYDAAINGMMDELDPYSEYFTPSALQAFEGQLSGSSYGIGVLTSPIMQDTGILIKTVLENSPAAAAGLLDGDVITKINGASVVGMTYFDALDLFDSATTPTISITTKRAGVPEKEYTILRKDFISPTVHVKSFAALCPDAKDDKRIAYIRLDLFGDNTADELAAAIQKVKTDGATRLVLDLRGNGGGSLESVLQIGNMLVPKGPILFAKEKNAEQMESFNSTLATPPFEKMVVLTDGDTASAAEVLASALQDSKAAAIVGQTTYGKGVMQSLFDLPTGGSIKFTTEEWFRRNGATINKLGVEPDVAIAAPPVFTNSIVLSENNTDEQVKTLKKVLTYLGFQTGPANAADAATYDDVTKAAVVKFQKNNGIPTNGIPGDDTLMWLNVAAMDKFESDNVWMKTAYTVIQK